MPVRGDDIRNEGREPPPGYRGRKSPNSQSFEQRPPYLEQESRTRPSEPFTAYKLSEMEKQTIILEKAAPDQGFGIAVSGGLDNPHYETGDTSVIVSDVVEGSPADGLLRMNDVILSVNGVNVEGVEHGVAVEALKNSGYSVKLIILRKRPSTAASSPTSIPSIQEPLQAYRRAPSENSKEPRSVVLSKHPSESYGLSLGTILFVKNLDQRGPAGRDGNLGLGDIILKINNEKVDDLSRSDAVNLMRNAPERLDLTVLKNKDIPPNMPSTFAGVNESVTMTRSHMVESSNNGMNGQDLLEFKAGQYGPPGGPRDGWDNTLRSTATYSVSSTGRRSDERERDIDARRDKKFHGEAHLVSFHRTGSSLGIQVAGGNAVGIFANAIKDGSPAQVAGLRVGDQILSANDIEFKDITREEAVLILLSLPEEVSLLVQYKKSVYDKSKEEPGDSFYVKAQFHYNSSDEDELSFRRGEVFHVLDTMNGGTIGSWRAQRVLQSGAETEVGIIPNKCRAEQLAIAQDLEAKKNANPKQGKSGTLKRKDTKSTTPKKKQYQAADQLDETSFQLDVKYPAYERVIRQRAGFVRPVVLLGPIADICRDKLIVEYAEKFTSPATFGRFDANKQSGIKLSAVRDNIASGKHSLLDVTPEGVEMLNFVGLEPIVVFMQPSSKQLIKDLRHDLTNKSHSARFVKKLYDQAETLSFEYPYLFTAVIPLERNTKWYTDCIDIIKKQQEDTIWQPEQMNQHHDDEIVFQIPRRSVGYDMDQSGLDLPGDLERKEPPAHHPDEEVVVAASAAVQEQAPVVQAFTVTPEVSEEDRRQEEDREFQRRQEEDREFQRRQEEDREFQRRQEEDREFQRRQEEEREFHRKQEEIRMQEEEKEYQRRQAEVDREREQDRREKDEYARQMEQREYERRQYEENRRSYDGDEQPRDQRKPYIPPGVKVLPGSLPPVVLKKTDSADRKASPRDEQDDARPAVQLRHVERDQEAEQYDERIGVKVSDLFDIGKDIEAGGEYMEDGRHQERRYRSDSDEDAGFRTQETRVVDTQDEERRGEVHEDMVRSSIKPVEAAVDFDDMFSSQQQQQQTTRSQTATEYRTSYQVTKQARNTVVDTSGGRRVESGVFSDYYPGRSRAKIVNIEPEDNQRYGKREEPHVKMEYEDRVQSEPAPYDRRPPGPSYPEQRRPPPPADDQAPSRPKAYSNMYPRPFSAQSSGYSYSRRATDQNDGRQYNGDYQVPVPEYGGSSYSYGQTAYRNPATDYDDSRETTSDFESVTDDEPTVVATARGYFTSRGGILTSEETGVSIYIPSGAIPSGIEQEIYFKVCNDNTMLPPLDTEKGETLLSPLVMCGPHGTKFLKPVELRLPHSASMTPEGWSFAVNNSSGEPENYKVGSNSVSVLVDHF